MSFKKKTAVVLSLLMSLGNSAGPLLGLAGERLAPWARVVLPGFFGAIILSARTAHARGTAVAPRVVDLRQARFSADPSDGELEKTRLLDTLLFPTSGAAQAGENGALAQALNQTLDDPADDSLDHLEAFVTANPQSRWVLAVETNRGLILYKRGYFSRAVEAYQTALKAGKDEVSGPAKDLADRALAEWMRMDCRVGHVDEAKALVALMEPRRPEGIAARWYEDDKEAVRVMEKSPARSFFCGPYALEKILSFEKSIQANNPLFKTLKSPKQGFNLAQVWGFSQELGMDMQMAKRSAGAKILLPSVVNWKLGHYAALVEEKNGIIHSIDPTFGNDTWLTEKALDDEASGYFLVPAGALPDGWTAVSGSEAATVWGKGLYGTSPVECPLCKTQLASGGCSSCHYMPRADIDLGMAAAVLVDTPLSYTPPVGPAIGFTLTYHSKTADPLTYSNFGSDWSFNWQGSIQYSFDNSSGTTVITTNLVLASPGGGEEQVPASGGYSPYTQSFISIAGNSGGLPSALTRKASNGAMEIYGLTLVGVGTAQALLTQVIDPQGNVATINYDGQFRISSVTDALGRPSVFSYGNANPFLITQITDPFGRSAIFNYDTNGELHSITDQLGLTSSFTYNSPSALSSDWVDSMTTPYGTTTFDYTGTLPDNYDDSIVRNLAITDPMGLKQYARFARNPLVPDTYPEIPTGITPAAEPTGGLFSTLYWDKKAMADDPLDPNSATQYQWYTTPTSTQSLFVASVEKPLESPVYYDYPGLDSGLAGASALMEPTAVGRMVLGGGSSVETQLYQKSYNSNGLVTQAIDPKSRQLNYTYDATGLNVSSITDGNGDVLQSSTYNGQFEPLSTIDAAGQTTYYTYNGAGQITSMTPPVGASEATQYNYDDQGFLTSVAPPQPGSTVRYAYDNVGRVRTKTDAVNGTVSYTYDNGDRVIQVSYPDGTRESYSYNKLDLQTSTDRQGSTTSYTYDNDRRMTGTTDPKGQTTAYGWCACGSMTSMTDPKGNQTNWTYDLEGRVTQKNYADGSFYVYQYDPAAGFLVSATDAKKQQIRYVYDVDQKLLNVNYLNAQVSTPNVAYQYDSVLGRLTSMTDGTGTSLYGYYPINGAQLGGGKLQSVVAPLGSTTVTTIYTYDADGRVVSRSIDGSTESYNYSNGELVGVSNPLGSFTYGYDSASARLANVAYPNGQAVTFGYFGPSDPLGAGRLKDITNMGAGATAGQVLSKFDYAYDHVGDFTQWMKQLGASPTTDQRTMTMGYDPASQLSAVTQVYGDGSPSQSVTFGYDGAGNRTLEQLSTTGLGSYTHNFGTNNLNQLTSETDNPISVVGVTSLPSTVLVNNSSVTEDSGSNFSTSIPPVAGASTPLTVRSIAADGQVTTSKFHVLNTVPFTTDANGNLTTDQTYRYSYDAEDRLVGITSANPTPPAMPDNITFIYDGMSRRVGIVEKHGSTVLTNKTFLWCKDRICEERNSSGNTVVKRFYDRGEQVNGTNYFYTFDHLRSVREVTNSSGVIQARYDYSPYGRVQKLVGNFDSDFGFAGMYVNKSTELNLTLYRAYDPEKGRWFSHDPVQQSFPFLRTGSNLYAYVNGDPIKFIDPRGLDALDPTLPAEEEGAAEAGPEFAEDWPTGPKNPPKPPSPPSPPGNTQVPSNPQPGGPAMPGPGSGAGTKAAFCIAGCGKKFPCDPLSKAGCIVLCLIAALPTLFTH